MGFDPAYVQGTWLRFARDDAPPMPELGRGRDLLGEGANETIGGADLNDFSQHLNWVKELTDSPGDNEDARPHLLGRTDTRETVSQPTMWGQQDSAAKSNLVPGGGRYAGPAIMRQENTSSSTSMLNFGLVPGLPPGIASCWSPARPVDQAYYGFGPIEPCPGMLRSKSPEEGLSWSSLGQPLERLSSRQSASSADTGSDGGEVSGFGRWEAPERREPPPQPQTLVHEQTLNGIARICWTVDAKKLRGSDKVAVSPAFEMPSIPGTFRMMLCPKAVSERKGGASFKKAKGRGFVQLKCEAALGEAGCGNMTLQICVGSGRPDTPWQSPLKGPVQHNFAENGVCCIPSRLEEEWNFSKAVDEASQTFVVCLEILPEEASAACS